MNQATQMEPDLQNNSQMSLKIQALFHATKSLQFSPPSSFAKDLGITKVEHQKLVIPAMTVLTRSNLPAKERDLELHELTFPLIICIRGPQLPEEKNEVFWMLTARPDRISNS